MGIFSSLFTRQTDTRLTDAVRSGAILVDVRSPGEFTSGSIPGAVNMPLDQLKGLSERLPRGKQIVVFCRSGNRSARAVLFLQQSGFGSVLDGGSLRGMQQCFKEIRT